MSAPVDVRKATDAALLAEYNRPAPKHQGTAKVEQRRARRWCRVRDELARRGLVSSFAETMASIVAKSRAARIGGAP